MSREDSLYHMLEVSTQMHAHISSVLEAKAREAEKARNWVCALDMTDDPFKTCMDFHEQVIEVIEGITKIEEGIVSHLKQLLDDGKDDMAGMAEMFSGDFEK